MPFGPSVTIVPRLPGVQPSMGVQGKSLRYFWTISPSSLIKTRVLYGFLFGWSSCCSPVSEKTPQQPASLHASPNMSVNGPGILHAVSNISCRSYIIPFKWTEDSLEHSFDKRKRARKILLEQFFLTHHGWIFWKHNEVLKCGEIERQTFGNNIWELRNQIFVIQELWPMSRELTIPGNPILTPFTMSQIFLALAITSSLVCNLGIGYWNTQHPTVSSELEIWKGKRIENSDGRVSCRVGPSDGQISRSHTFIYDLHHHGATSWNTNFSCWWKKNSKNHQ